MGGMITFVMSGSKYVGRVTSKDRKAQLFRVDKVYTLRLRDDGVTWVRGYDNEDARALEATMLLVRSAR